MKHTLEHSRKRTDINEHLTSLYFITLQMSAKLVVELGVRSGESTVAFLEGVNRTDGRVVSVDIEECPKAREMVERYGLGGRWTFVRSDDIEFGKGWDRSRKVDIVFVDTSHLYEHTKREIEVFEPIVRPGGVLIFHDTTTHPEGVMKPIQEFLKGHPGYGFENASYNSGMGVILKPRVP